MGIHQAGHFPDCRRTIRDDSLHGGGEKNDDQCEGEGFLHFHVLPFFSYCEVAAVSCATRSGVPSFLWERRLAG